MTLRDNWCNESSQARDYTCSILHPLYSCDPPRFQSTSSPFGHWTGFPVNPASPESPHLKKHIFVVRDLLDSVQFSTWTNLGMRPSEQMHPLKLSPSLLLSSAIFVLHAIWLALSTSVPSLQKSLLGLGQSNQPPFLHPNPVLIFAFLLPLHLHYHQLRMF